MARREFSKAVKVAVIKRSTRDGVTYCEACGGFAKRWQIDHRRPDGLLGEPTLENAQLLGECCYAPKNADDTRTIAQAKRREARYLGVTKAPTLRSRGFSPPAAKGRTLTKQANGIPAIRRAFAIVED